MRKFEFARSTRQHVGSADEARQKSLAASMMPSLLERSRARFGGLSMSGSAADVSRTVEYSTDKWFMNRVPGSGDSSATGIVYGRWSIDGSWWQAIQFVAPLIGMVAVVLHARDIWPF
jgi:hypothetical protein